MAVEHVTAFDYINPGYPNHSTTGIDYEQDSYIDTSNSSLEQNFENFELDRDAVVLNESDFLFDFSELSNGVKPRDYQKDLFLRSLNKNTIIVLETGSGKTLIASMIIEYFGLNRRTLEFENFSTVPRTNVHNNIKLSFFLCNTTILVEQQGKSLLDTTNRAIKIYKSRGKHSQYSCKEWRESWKSAEVHVMTSQTLLNCLRHGFILISEIMLLIFDECHNSRKGTPYNRIMREFYDLSQIDSRPRIFGMTASTANAYESMEYSVNRIQQTMDSEIQTLSSTNSKFSGNSNVTNVTLEYDLDFSSNNEWLSDLIFSQIKSYKEINSIKSEVDYLKKELGYYAGLYVMHALTTYWKDLVFKTGASQVELQDKLFGQSENHHNSNYTSDEKYIHTSDYMINEINSAIKLIYSYSGLDNVLFINRNPKKNINNFLEYDYDHLFAPGTHSWISSKPYLTSKVNVLLQFLMKYKSRNQLKSLEDPFCAIIFVNRRSTAYALSLIIQSLSEFDFIKCEPFIGNGNIKKKPILQALNLVTNCKKRMTQLELMSTLERFKAGKTNLLVATQVAEEGLDVSMCNLVVRFDPALTLVSFVQARGRARHLLSEYVIMVPRNISQVKNEFNLSKQQKSNKFDSFENIIDKSSHRDISHYNSLASMEKDFNSFSSTTNVLSQNDTKPNLTEGQISVEISFNVEIPKGFLDIAEEMRVETGISLSPDLEDILKSLAYQIQSSAINGKIEKTYFKVPETGAQLTTNSAKVVLNKYVQSLPKDFYTDCKISYEHEERKSKFRYKLALPGSSTIRLVVGPWSDSNKSAKQSAIFYSVIILFFYGALNDYLMPVDLKTSYLRHSIKKNILGNAYSDLENIISNKYCVNVFDPFSVQKFNSLSPTKSDHTSTNTNNTALNQESKISIGKKRKFDSSNCYQTKAKKNTSTNSESILENGAISYETFNPTHWTPATFYNNSSSIFSSSKKYLDLYVYVCDLNPFSFENENLNQKLNLNETHLPNDKYNDNLLLLAFFVNPIPKDLTIPIYSEIGSNIPKFYRFDPLSTKNISSNNPFNRHLNKSLGSKAGNNPSDPNYNKLSLSIDEWDKLVLYTSSIFSLIYQTEFRIDPKDASYAFSPPTKEFEAKLLSTLKKRRDFRVEKHNFNAPKNLRFYNTFLEFTNSLPNFTNRDIDWTQIRQFLYDPNRLTSFHISKWEDMLDKYVIISDINKFSLCTTKKSLRATSNDTILDILSELGSNCIIENETLDEISEDFCKSFDISPKSSNIYNILQSLIPNKAVSIRLIDYLFQNSLIFNDLNYNLVTDCSLIQVETLEFPIDYTRSQGVHNTSPLKISNSNKTSTIFFEHKTSFEQSKAFNKLLPNPLNDLRDKLTRFKKSLEVPGLSDKDIESLEIKIFNCIANYVRSVVTIPSLTRVLNWSVGQIHQLSVLPSLMHRLHSTLIHCDVSEALNLPISPHSLPSDMVCSDSKDSILSEDIGFNFNDEVITVKDLFALSSKFAKSPNKSFDILQKNKDSNSEYLNEVVFNNYHELNTLPSWLYRTALTSQVASDDVNYQRLEMLGDSVLKLLIATQLFAGLVPLISHEGILSSYTGLLVSNNFLAKVSRKTGLCYGVWCSRFESKSHFPPGKGWRRSVFPLPRTISYYSQPWSFERGCTSRVYNYDNFSDRFIYSDCICKPTVVDYKNSIPQTSSSVDTLDKNDIDLNYKDVGAGEYCTRDFLKPEPNSCRNSSYKDNKITKNTPPDSQEISSVEEDSNQISLSDIILFSNLAKLNSKKLPLHLENNLTTNTKDAFINTESEPRLGNKDALYFINKNNISLELSIDKSDSNTANSNIFTKDSILGLNNIIPSESTCLLDKPSHLVLENQHNHLPHQNSISNFFSKTKGEMVSNHFDKDDKKKYSDICKSNEFLPISSSISSNKKTLCDLMDLISPEQKIDVFKEKAPTVCEIDYAKHKDQPNSKPSHMDSTNLHQNYPKPIHYFFPTKKPPSFVGTKPKHPFHKQHFKLTSETPAFSKLALKTQADLVESVLGASYKFSGIELAFKTAKSLGMVKSNWNEWNDLYESFNSLHKNDQLDKSSLSNNPFRAKIRVDSPASIIVQKYNKVKHVESILGYKFKNPSILVEALTHSSASKADTSSYERLEFLGDAVISMLITDYYYDKIKVKKPLSPHIITLVKHVAVSNSVLGLISLLHNFHTFLLFDSNVLKNEIEAYVSSINLCVSNWKNQKITSSSTQFNQKTSVKNVFNLSSNNDKGSKSCNSNENSFKVKLRKPMDTILYSSDENEDKDNNNYNLLKNLISQNEDTDDLNLEWLNLPPELWAESDPPKTMGDIHESLMGAVFVDSGFSIKVVEKVFNKIFLPFIKKYVGPHQITLNSVIHIQMLIQSKRCTSFKFETMGLDDAIKNPKINSMITRHNKKFKKLDIYKNSNDNTIFQLNKKGAFNSFLASKGTAEESTKFLENSPMIPNLVELKKTGRAPTVTFLILHKREIIGFGGGLNTKKSKARAANQAVSNWDSDSIYSILNVIEGCCNCAESNLNTSPNVF
ncbi:Endoribonuclease Dicer-like protein [Smittium culicis]|uniref:Endoribonuclease Dicer-like protein n=1 Tax=Smittium culicis TaxID=133412 RepID=A0A1R1XGG4_9FUNG|nr:Endoribonuclease Dicer-like protein [Smittium culicis]